MVTSLIFVHGYSESSLGAYFDFPKRVSAASGIPYTNIYLSAFDSLDDDVTISDIADALESKIVALEARGVDMASTATIVHSTGALIVRRWILNRVQRNRAVRRSTGTLGTLAIPSHFISMAGANHGSTLAQTGKSFLGYMQKLFTHHILAVGKRVLTDLDYGSGFLIDLNRQWLIETVAPEYLSSIGGSDGSALADLFVFSMSGDSHGHGLGVNIFPPSAEPGSDNTVRISGANMNYTFMVADPEAMTIVPLPTKPVAHHILRGYSHYGPDTGIWGHEATPDISVNLLCDALAINDAPGYERLRIDWERDLVAWTAANAPAANATLLFSLHDRSGAPVEDATVVILEQQAADNADAAKAAAGSTNAGVAAFQQSTIANLQKVSQCILNEPIRNAVNPSNVSFYIGFDSYKTSSPHYYHIVASSASKLVAYKVIDYTGPTGPTDDAHVIKPNQCTYVDVVMDRVADDTSTMYPYKLPLNTATWNPPLIAFPSGSIDDPVTPTA